MTINQQINNYLLSLGFTPNLKGTLYIRDALAVLMQKESLCNLRLEIYPLLSEKYQTSIENIEKNISNAIEKVWLKGNIDLLYSEFLISGGEDKAKPTVKEFLYSTKNNINKSI